MCAMIMCVRDICVCVCFTVVCAWSVLCVLMKILSHASAKKKTKILKGFKFGTFIGRFQMTSWQSRG